jgi:hypothetical protein
MRRQSVGGIGLISGMGGIGGTGFNAVAAARPRFRDARRVGVILEEAILDYEPAWTLESNRLSLALSRTYPVPRQNIADDSQATGPPECDPGPNFAGV